MAVLINGMKMPKEPDEWIEIVIFGDGKVIQTGESWRNLEDGKYYYTPTTPEKFFPAVPVPPHGRLIDADALEDMVIKEKHFCAKAAAKHETIVELYKSFGLHDAELMIEAVPTIIPEDEVV